MTTYSGTTNIGTKTVGFTVRAGSSIVPSLSDIVISEANAVVIAAAIGGYVKGYSQLSVDVTSAGTYGSSIVSKTVTVDGSTLSAPGTSGTIVNAGSRTISATVKDSRGRTATLTETITVLDYSPPSLSGVLFRRAFSNGAIDDSGTYARVDGSATVTSLKPSTTEKNALNWKLEMRPFNGTWATVASGAGTVGAAYAISALGNTTVTISQAREMRLTLTDKLTSTAISGIISAQVTLALGDSGIGIGKRWAQGAIDAVGDIYFTGTMKSGSVPADRVNSGTLNLARIPDFDAAKITSGVLNPARIPLEQYNVLWSGGYYMDDSQTVNLSQLISAQNTGIILVWSAYASGSSQNYNWHHQLISKYQVVVGSGAGVIDTWLAGAGASTFVTKYVYVSDNKISGNANNSVAPNNVSVLRAVLGV